MQILKLSSFRLPTLLITCLMASGCAHIDYYAQAVSGHLALMRARVPVAESLANPDLEPATRQKLESARDIRAYAVNTIGLPDNGSYNTWVDLGRPAVTWNVVATERFSVRPERWCFPVAGCLNYRGYFDRDQAIAFADALAADGLDTTVGAATAYSSLGWFQDPIVSTMFRGDDTVLAGVLFHELAHQQLYVGDDSSFNESFATFVEDVAVARWLETTNRTELFEPWRQRRARREEFIELLASARARLASIYAEGGSDNRLSSAKAAAFAQLRADYAALRARWGGYSGYDSWFEKPLNNARLAGVATYTQWVGSFETLFERSDQHFQQFFKAAADLAALPLDQRRDRLNALAQESDG